MREQFRRLSLHNRSSIPQRRACHFLESRSMSAWRSIDRCVNANRLFSATLSQVTTEQSWFHVPQTSILLNLVTFADSPLDRRAVGRTILNGQVQVRRHLAMHGDSYIWTTEECELTGVSLAH